MYIAQGNNKKLVGIIGYEFFTKRMSSMSAVIKIFPFRATSLKNKECGVVGDGGAPPSTISESDSTRLEF